MVELLILVGPEPPVERPSEPINEQIPEDLPGEMAGDGARGAKDWGKIRGNSYDMYMVVAMWYFVGFEADFKRYSYEMKSVFPHIFVWGSCF